MKRIGILGASGYVGGDLVRILLRHPEVSQIIASSVSHESKTLADIYPSFSGITPLVLGSAEEVLDGADIVFAALPHGLSEGPARKSFDRGKLFIDLGADFRLADEASYTAWYGKRFEDPALHVHAVYGLPELNREKIRSASIVANPGCYPTCASLGLYPALSLGLALTDRIVIDAKSGVSGAGRSLTLESHYSEVDGALAPYKVTNHRHRPEIDQTLSAMAGKSVKCVFVPHLVPMVRGMVATMYLELGKAADGDSMREAWADFYRDEPFVRVLPKGKTAGSRWVKFSNYCDISVHVDDSTGTLIIVSAIDNLGKGAATQAVQNMNIACGFPETAGIDFIPPAI